MFNLVFKVSYLLFVLGFVSFKVFELGFWVNTSQLTRSNRVNKVKQVWTLYLVYFILGTFSFTTLCLSVQAYPIERKFRN